MFHLLFVSGFDDHVYEYNHTSLSW